MLRLLLCCSYCLNVVVSAWTLNQVDAAAKHSSNRAPALTYTVPPHSPLFLRRKTNIAKHTWKRIGCSYCWVALGLCSLYFGLMLAHLGTMLGLCWVLLNCFGPMLGFIGLSLAHLGTMLPPRGLLWAYVHFILGLCWTILGLCWDYVGFCWVVLGLCWPILGLCWAFLVSMLGHLGPVLAILGLCCAVLGLCRRKKRHQSAKVVWKASFSWYLQCFLHIAGFRSTSLETTKMTKFGSRAGKTHFLQQLDSL